MYIKQRKSSFIGLLVSSTLLSLLLLSSGAARSAFASGCLQRSAICPTTSRHPLVIPFTKEAVAISPSTLNGLDKTMTKQLPVDVLGAQNGFEWHVQVGLTQLSNANHALPSSWSVALTGLCDNDIFNGGICQMPDCRILSAGQSEPLTPLVSTITASGRTPSLTSVLSSNLCGSGFDMTITTTLSAPLLAKNTYVGTYTGLFNLTVIDGP